MRLGLGESAGRQVGGFPGGGGRGLLRDSWHGTCSVTVTALGGSGLVMGRSTVRPVQKLVPRIIMAIIGRRGTQDPLPAPRSKPNDCCCHHYGFRGFPPRRNDHHKSQLQSTELYRFNSKKGEKKNPSSESDRQTV